ncbi:MAG TPA: hypothetical protein PLD92_04810 [Candidatus Omnitrophota bacterium]|nr:hypothetical protein [Candidatus Omnitrophota bacterium]
MTIKEDLGSRSISQTGSTASEMVAAQTEAEVKAGFALAQLNKRNEEDARVGILRACGNPVFAEKSIYKKPIGKDTIRGLSIRFAEEMIRNWRNIKVIQNIIFDSARVRIVRVICYDLEANIPYSEDIIIEKTVERKSAVGREVLGERLNSYGEKISIVVATEDEVKVKQGANVSKAIRNNSLRLIPSHILDEARIKCEETARTKIASDPMAFLRKVLDSFAKLGITPSDVEKYLQKPPMQARQDDIADLQQVYNAIKDGETTWAKVLETRVQDGEIVEDENNVGISADEINDLSAGDPATHTAPDKPQGKKNQ